MHNIVKGFRTGLPTPVNIEALSGLLRPSETDLKEIVMRG